MTWSLSRSPPDHSSDTDPFIPAADLNFQYSAAQGRRPPVKRLLNCLADALSRCYMTYTAIRETLAPPRVRDPAVTCLCAHSTRMAHPREAEGAASVAGGSLPSTRAYTGDSSLSRRFLRPHAFGSDSHLRARLRSPYRAYIFPVCRTSESGAWPQLGGPPAHPSGYWMM